MGNVQIQASDIIFPHLGHSLRDLLQEKNMSQRELAARTAVSTAYINSIVQGNRPISTNFAYKLEQIFNINADRIMHQQILRELSILRAEEGYESMLRDSKILPKIMPLVPVLLGKDEDIAKSSTYELIEKLRRFFKISSLENLPELYQVRAYPDPPSKRANLYLLSAWALYCEELVNLVESEVSFDREKFARDKYDLHQKIRQCKKMQELNSLLKPYGIKVLCSLPF